MLFSEKKQMFTFSVLSSIKLVFSSISLKTHQQYGWTSRHIQPDKTITIIVTATDFVTIFIAFPCSLDTWSEQCQLRLSKDPRSDSVSSLQSVT